jgi:hypothetical protein
MREFITRLGGMACRWLREIAHPRRCHRITGAVCSAVREAVPGPKRRFAASQQDVGNGSRSGRWGGDPMDGADEIRRWRITGV